MKYFQRPERRQARTQKRAAPWLGERLLQCVREGIAHFCNALIQ